jgi:hypothetical protein
MNVRAYDNESVMIVATDDQQNYQFCQVLAGKTAAQPGTVNTVSIFFAPGNTTRSSRTRHFFQIRLPGPLL